MKDSVVIERQDGTIYILEELGIRVISFNPPGPNIQHTFQSLGTYKNLWVDMNVQQLTIPLIFDVYATDNYDYELKRLKVLKIFRSHEEFYIYTSRIPYLRWRVVAETFSYPRKDNFWLASNISVNLVCATGYAETAQTTLEPFTFDRSTWGFGLGINLSDPPVYSFQNIKKFNFINLGTIPLLCEQHPVTILFKGIVNDQLTIKNNRTNQTWAFKRKLTKQDQLLIEGMVPSVNNALAFNQCNHSYLDYLIGDNQIEISGTDDFTISFDTRFYY
ncbi:phage tail family protein [Melissococcus plutonius]|uniref:phage tail family protein n=1 Tax=Melissococcus plutonius TaxID=33970 RepID=UPI0021E5A982|nr:phage tail family protein [Melissococcus plutonius]MCV2505648.1 phage tail family protein [Melissococcus plutonius]